MKTSAFDFDHLIEGRCTESGLGMKNNYICTTDSTYDMKDDDLGKKLQP